MAPARRSEKRRTRIRALVLWLTGGAAAVGAWSLGPLPQDPAYHAFADERMLSGVPNFWNTVSSLALSLVGAAGLRWLWLARTSAAPHWLFFAGVTAAGLGSAWYHLQPDNARLLWDRLAMALAFAGFFSLVIHRFVHAGAGRRLAIPLALTACSSVIYWYLSERAGAGDLRPYVLVQFGPLLLVPAVLLLYPADRAGRRWIAAALLCYALAKAFELADREIMVVLGLSGHTVKHLWAALGALCVLLMIRRHRAAAAPEGRAGPPRP